MSQCAAVYIRAVLCGRADLLDPALLRAGRFDRKVQLLRPDTAGRFEILKVTYSALPVERMGHAHMASSLTLMLQHSQEHAVRPLFISAGTGPLAFGDTQLLHSGCGRPGCATGAALWQA